MKFPHAHMRIHRDYRRWINNQFIVNWNLIIFLFRVVSSLFHDWRENVLPVCHSNVVDINLPGLFSLDKKRNTYINTCVFIICVFFLSFALASFSHNETFIEQIAWFNCAISQGYFIDWPTEKKKKNKSFKAQKKPRERKDSFSSINERHFRHERINDMHRKKNDDDDDGSTFLLIFIRRVEQRMNLYVVIFFQFLWERVKEEKSGSLIEVKILTT